jgi:UDP-glucose 4-epimerase
MVAKLRKPIKPKRVVILGSGGFISSKLEQILKLNNIHYLAIKRKDIDLSKKSSTIKLKKIITNQDSLVIIAAKAPCKNMEMLEKNIKIIQNICISLENKDINHMLYISSDAVYSDSLKKINEYSKTDPDNFHGLMHLCREKIISLISKNNLCILRPTLIYGKEDPHNGYGPNSFLRLAKKNQPIKLFGKGEELRDHIDVNDVAKIIYNSLIYKYVGILNLVTGTKISFLEIAQVVIKNTKSSSKILFTKRTQPMPHNGYRLFNPNIIKKTFKDIKTTSINKNKLYWQ